MKAFLESEIESLPAERCRFHIIPAPLEKTVSYGAGTARGPEAILEASYQLEAFDGISCPCEAGIFTHAIAKTLEAIEDSVAQVLNLNGLPILLGGEHTVTLGALRALKARDESFGIVQFDAHADLRDEYEGDPFSHACVMRRALELDIPIFQIGVRALSKEEADLRTRIGIGFLDGYCIGQQGIPSSILPKNFPKKIYLSIDLDALDPSIMPSTGTPEPGGLNWFQFFKAIELVLKNRTVVGFDVVELAPIKGQHAPDFLAARLIYNLMGKIERLTQKI
jgi:agmatinase